MALNFFDFFSNSYLDYNFESRNADGNKSEKRKQKQKTNISIRNMFEMFDRIIILKRPNLEHIEKHLLIHELRILND